MNKKIIIAIILILLVGGLFYSYNLRREAGEESSESETNSKSVNPTSISAENADMKEFKVEEGDFYFKPEKITVRKDDKVKITFSNIDGDDLHNFILDGYYLHTEDTKAHETSTLEFVADKTGTFNFFCSIGDHKDRGMIGTLTVE